MRTATSRTFSTSLTCSLASSLLLALLLVACGDEAADPEQPLDMSTTLVDMGSAQDMMTSQDMSLSDSSSAPDMADVSRDMTAPPGEVAVPTTSEEVFAYLQAKTYASLPAEPAVHASTGPHGRVRTFVNTTLATSIRASNTTHPVGSASVKELYSSSDLLTGWAVSVKVSDAAGDGKDWYWYEVFSTSTNSPVVNSTGAGGCTGCHGGGTDFILTPGPFTP